jgi:DNA-binding beta-propeller fold protein YncE
MFAIPQQRCMAACAVAALLCGCTGGGSPALGLPGQAPTVFGAARSWMAPDAKQRDLLYLSDESAHDVYVYSWPGLELKGTLTGFDAPNGECADKAGDVYVTNEDQSEILEYAHGGTSSIKTLVDTGEYPVGCSVDPTTGNLAVTNIDTTKGGGPGNVAIYPDASGTPATYIAPAFYYYFFCGYDGHGNLFVDGTNNGSTFEFAELPRGGSAFGRVTLDQTIDFPGGVQWDGRHVAVGDQEQPYIYEFAVNGSSGRVVEKTPLDDTDDVSQFWIAGGRVVTPDFLNNEVQVFKYPAGGSAVKAIPNISTPIGSALSKGTK